MNDLEPLVNEGMKLLSERFAILTAERDALRAERDAYAERLGSAEVRIETDGKELAALSGELEEAKHHKAIAELNEKAAVAAVESETAAMREATLRKCEARLRGIAAGNSAASGRSIWTQAADAIAKLRKPAP